MTVKEMVKNKKAMAIIAVAAVIVIACLAGLIYMLTKKPVSPIAPTVNANDTSTPSSTISVPEIKDDKKEDSAVSSEPTTESKIDTDVTKDVEGKPNVPADKPTKSPKPFTQEEINNIANLPGVKDDNKVGSPNYEEKCEDGYYWYRVDGGEWIKDGPLPDPNKPLETSGGNANSTCPRCGATGKCNCHVGNF